MTDSAYINEFIQAANYTPNGNGTITRVVIHDMEFPEKPRAAHDVAMYFHNQPHSESSGSSAHYCVDSDTIVGCVHEVDRAWHAPPNSGSIGIEHAGYGNQTAAQWADPYSEAMLRVSAKLTADLCHRYNLPIVWLSVNDLLAGKHGITSHNNVSLAWHKSNHTDPGPNFPVNHYLDLVRQGGQPQKEWDEMATKEEFEAILNKVLGEQPFNVDGINSVVWDLATVKHDAIIARLDEIDKKLK